MKTLSERTGKSIWAMIPMFTQGKIKQFKLHGVEQGGIWVESQETTD